MNTHALTDIEKQEIDKWVAKFPNTQRQSAVIMALRVIQAQRNHLTKDNMNLVADYLNMPPVQVYEVASFYSLYAHKKQGKYVLKVCDSLSCCMRGALDVISFLKSELGVDLNETSKDGLFTLATAECLAACTDAPVVIVNDCDYHKNVTKESLRSLIKQCQDAHER